MGADGHRLVFECFGVVAEVRTEDEALFEALPPGWRPSASAPSVRVAVSGDGVIEVDGETKSTGGAGTLLRLGAVLRHHLAEHAVRYTFIHAGVVSAAPAAEAIVIPGSTWSGKTTLVAELVAAGATYYSDEYAVVDPDGLIHPFAKPLSIRRGARQTLVAVADSQIATQPARAGLILVTSYQAGARWEPRLGTPGEGAEALLAHTVPARARPGAALAAVSALARGSRVLSGVRGEASAVVEMVLAGA